jgi:hypothetical protein
LDALRRYAGAVELIGQERESGIVMGVEWELKWGCRRGGSDEDSRVIEGALCKIGIIVN